MKTSARTTKEVKKLLFALYSNDNMSVTSIILGLKGWTLTPLCKLLQEYKFLKRTTDEKPKWEKTAFLNEAVEGDFVKIEKSLEEFLEKYKNALCEYNAHSRKVEPTHNEEHLTVQQRDERLKEAIDEKKIIHTTNLHEELAAIRKELAEQKEMLSKLLTNLGITE